MATFSSFADLKDLRHSLRQQEADLAQAKADAIVVSEEQAKTNPLKQKAARTAAFSTQAQTSAASLSQNSATTTSADTAVHQGADHKKQAPPREGERPTRDHAHDGRDRRDRDRDRDRRDRNYDRNSDRERSPATLHERRVQQAKAGERVDHALQRLQKHHDGKNSNAVNSANGASDAHGATVNQEPRHARAHGEQRGEQGQRGEQRQHGEHGQRGESRARVVKVIDPADKAAAKAKAKNQNRHGADKSRNQGPILQGRYFDLEALKAVREVQDSVRYQTRRVLYRALDAHDRLIEKQVATLQAAALAAAKEASAVEAAANAASVAIDNTTSESAANTAASVVSTASTTSMVSAASVVNAASAASVTAPKALPKVGELLAQALKSEAVVAAREQLKTQVAAAAEDYKYRCEHLPPLEYPEQLPVSQRQDEIIAAIQKNQVVIIAGETGSGKTTQIPKMCLAAGLGRKGLIGHTQPRRIAARAVAARIAAEMHEELGHSVSYKVRFTDISSDESYIKLMTDGILLSELASDRLLLSYDVIIIDEAHERSLNIDFLLGYLKGLLVKRPELKLIITSATIDVERFAQHFNNAPIIEVSGRTYPVEVVYMPLYEDSHQVYIEEQDGTGHYESLSSKTLNSRAAAESVALQRDDPELQEGPGAWHDYHYQQGTRMAMGMIPVGNSANGANGSGSGGGGTSSAGGAGNAAAFTNRSKRDNSADDDRDLVDTLDIRQGILQAFNYLQKRGRGDTLVFLPGERDILEVSQFLGKAHLLDTEIVPLYARLATTEQNKIFTEHSGVRIVLATNIAETSLTVPSIRYVIDPGLARISRYSARTKVQRLPIEPISQASANQRKGRCGRVSNGICVRLYSKDDFMQRPEFTDPEILRTNLASVLLQMAALRLGRIEQFPFIDAPAPRQISDGLRLLHELGATSERAENYNFGETVAAIAAAATTGVGTAAGGAGAAQGANGANGAGSAGAASAISNRGRGHGHEDEHGDNLQLTPVGRMLSRLPCDPRLGRMIIEADKTRALSEVLIIASLLAVIDPRECPMDKKEAAQQFHARFNDDKSDFCSILKLYDYIKELQSTLSGSAMRRRLKHEFISFLRVREWLDVHRQLRVSAQAMGLKLNSEAADYASIHKALLSGLLSQIGMLEPNGSSYLGARGSKFLIFPASPLSKKSPKWLCAAELSETSRLFALTVASITPEYVEPLADHLLRNSYAEPYWSKANGAVMAYLTRTLYGLPIVQRRVVQYQKIDPQLSHELMIRDGFVAGNLKCNHRFFTHNLSLIDDVEYLEDKVRRRDLLVDSVTLEHFYQERIPEHICNIRDFDKWWLKKSKEDPHYLDFSYELIAKGDIMAIEDRSYPEFWQQGPLRFKLSYVFDPSNERDGVTVHIPITVLNQVQADDFLWQIRGLRDELFAALIRSLPKRLRRNLIPAPEYAKALSESLQGYIAQLESAGDSRTTAAGAAGAAGATATGATANGGAGGVSGAGKGASKGVAKGAGGSKSKGAGSGNENLFSIVAHELTRMGGELIAVEDFDRTQIEPYLFMNFAIEDVNGQEIAFGKDFIALASQLQNKAREVLHQVVKTHQTTAPAQNWEFGMIKKEQVTKQGTLSITAYPALTDRGEGVTLELYDSPERQMRAMRQGAIKLLALTLKSPAAYLETHLPNRAKLSMYYQPLGTVKELIDDLMLCAINSIMEQHGGIPWDENSFTKLQGVVRTKLNDETLALAKIAEQSLVKAHELKRYLKGKISLDLARSYADLSAQLDRLIYKGFVSDCGREHLLELPRYLQAALERVPRLQRDPVRDQMYVRTLELLQEDYEKALRSYHQDQLPPPLLEVKWMLEELRVSYFAQHLGVHGPISDKRIWAELERISKDYPAQK